MRLLSLCVAILILGLSSEQSFSGQKIAGHSEQTQHAWASVTDGSAVVLMRHALAPGGGDPVGFKLRDCSTQRNLSDQGRAQAVNIGNTLRQNGINSPMVLSSQWCRCLETARLLDMGEPVEAPMLNSFFEDRSTEFDQTRSLKNALRRWISDASQPVIVVTHQVNISALTGQFTGSGDMLIVTLHNDEAAVLARVSTE